MHNNEIRQYSPAKVHKLLKVEKKPGVVDARSIDDYLITVGELPGLACEDVQIN